MNSLPKTVTLQRRGCNLNSGPSAPESSMLTTRLHSHPKYSTESILSNSTRKLLRFEITRMLIAVQEKKIIVSFIIISGTLSFSMQTVHGHVVRTVKVNSQHMN